MRNKIQMQILILPLKILNIHLIIIIGESYLNKRIKIIALLILAFLYNNLLGFTTKVSMLLMSILQGSYLFILSIMIIGFLILAYLITINIYVKRKKYNLTKFT